MLPPGHGLGDLRLQAERSAEVQVVLIQIIGAVQRNIRSGNAKGQLTERDQRVLQTEASRHARDHLIDLFILRLPLAAAAESVDLILDGRLQKMSDRDIEAAVEQ